MHFHHPSGPTIASLGQHAPARRPALGGAARRVGVAFSTITWFLQRSPLVFFLSGRLPATATRPAPGGATRRLGVAFSTITWFLQRPPLVFFLLGRLRCPLYHHLVFLGTAPAFAFMLCSGTSPPSPGLVPTSHISLGL